MKHFLSISTLSILFSVFYFSNSTFAAEDSVYDFSWLDKDKEVYVLQNKIYPKDGTFNADIGYLSNITNEFHDIHGCASKVGYYLAEQWAVEIQ